MASSSPENDANPTAEPGHLRDTVALAAKSDGQVQLGDFEIDENGRLRPRPDGAPISFGFSYNGIDFIAKVEPGTDGRISLDAELGKLPYRAEIGERRRLTRQIVRAAQDLPRGRIDISDTSDMHLTARMEPAALLTPTAVLTALTAILLDFKPYLDLLHEVMLAPQGLEPGPPALKA